jgi:hypothetical protein
MFAKVGCGSLFELKKTALQIVLRLNQGGLNALDGKRKLETEFSEQLHRRQSHQTFFLRKTKIFLFFVAKLEC